MMNALNYFVLAEASTGRLIATLIAAIVLILVLILKFRVQAFISLLLASIFVGLASGTMSMTDIGKTIESSMGSSLGFIATIIGVGAIFGAMIEHCGGAQSLANGMLRITGEKRATLVAAVKAGGLAGALSGEGPFTIFAPTNAAFAKLPEGTVATLLKPENKGKLASILKYHVVAGKVMAADVKAGKVKTLNGAKATIAVAGGKVTIDKANIVKTDIVGTNGVIHVIDSVILPAAK
ncbi:fasciclin domain-containing protein [Akkermansiaceae bacterium]|nr:fasciclin domain-containing protein [Akkermansiaceae bacterium]